MGHVRLGLGALATIAVALACRASTPPADDPLASDLTMLCGRIADRNVSAFSQPTYRSDTMRTLTPRVDQGDDDARCELSQLMRRHARRPCRTTAAGLATSCE